MSGAIMALSGVGGGAGGGGGTLGALNWANIAGYQIGANAALTVSGISSPHSFTATLSGVGSLSYILNGTPTAYGGAFNVSAGATLAWQVGNGGKATRSGTITVTDTTTGLVVDTFNYVIAGDGNQ